MLLSALAVAVIGASAQPIRLAAPTLSVVQLEQASAEFYTEHLAEQLSGRGVQVTTAKQIASVLGLERQKQLMGCNEAAASCLAELGDALGVDGLVQGEIARLEGSFQVNVKVLSPRTSTPLASFSGRAASQEALTDLLTVAARRLATDLAAKLERQLPEPTAQVLATEAALSRPLRGKAWIPAAAAVVLAGVGTYLYVEAAKSYSVLRTTAGPLSEADARRLRDDGNLFQTLCAVSFGVGAAALAAAGVMFFYRRDIDTLVAWQLAPLPGGLALAFGGTWP